MGIVMSEGKDGSNVTILSSSTMSYSTQRTVFFDMMEVNCEVKPCIHFERKQVKKYDPFKLFLGVKPNCDEVDFHSHSHIDNFICENSNESVLAAGAVFFRSGNFVYPCHRVHWKNWIN